MKGREKTPPPVYTDKQVATAVEMTPSGLVRYGLIKSGEVSEANS